MRSPFRPNSDRGVPVYRQVADFIRGEILCGRYPRGSRLPATRKLAEEFGLNRATILAAFALLEQQRLIRSYVGRGSFVVGEPRELQGSGAAAETISFAAGRVRDDLLPLDAFRLTVDEVLAQDDLSALLQLGSSYGYAPLRRYLLEQARQAGVAGAEDDVLITSGCQQALDLLQRTLVRPGDAVAVEDPVYPGLKRVFEAAGARLIGIPVHRGGLALDQLERALERERPRLVIVTPSFQNPTGVSLSREDRVRLVDLVLGRGVILVENDTYAGLRYRGEEPPGLKATGGADVVLLRTFSKVSFPGMRVGWVIGPRPLLARLAEAKRNSDLHTDNLSQAVLWRFAESGRLGAHLERLRGAGSEQLSALLNGLKKHMPEGARWTEPEGGMNVWVWLPDGVDAAAAAERAAREGVSFLHGRHFEVTHSAAGALRLSFTGLQLEEIRVGVEILGQVFKQEAARATSTRMLDPSPILV